MNRQSKKSIYSVKETRKAVLLGTCTCVFGRLIWETPNLPWCALHIAKPIKPVAKRLTCFSNILTLKLRKVVDFQPLPFCAWSSCGSQQSILQNEGPVVVELPRLATENHVVNLWIYEHSIPADLISQNSMCVSTKNGLNLGNQPNTIKINWHLSCLLVHPQNRDFCGWTLLPRHLDRLGHCEVCGAGSTGEILRCCFPVT